MQSVLASQKDIVETVTLSDEFSIFAEALSAADLLETLKDQGPYTVFAPSDEVFSNLPVGTLDYLFKPENKRILTCMLRYHIVSGKITAEEIARFRELKALNGEVLTIAARYGTVMVDRGTITVENIECSNGLIHVIDQVAVPKRWL